MKSLDHIVGIAQICPRAIVLPEATDPRMLEAARRAVDSKISRIKLVGNPGAIQQAADKTGVSLQDIEIIDHMNHPKLDAWCELLAERRKHKGLTIAQAREIFSDPLFFGAMMVREFEAEGMVAGAVNTTGNVIRSSVQIIGTAPGIKTVSSCFVMILPEEKYGTLGALMFADCGVVPDPSVEQLADIAISTSDMLANLIGSKPQIAMLSFSTAGSAKHPSVDKMIQAAEIVKDKRPDLNIDGELQADAAIIEAIGKRKSPNSKVAGNANVLIFPDLNSGNIAYKLTERLANAKAYGPLLQGLALPVNDLSRGCNANDIYNVIAITVVEAHAIKERCHCEFSKKHLGEDRDSLTFPCDRPRKEIFSEVLKTMKTADEELASV